MKYAFGDYQSKPLNEAYERRQVHGTRCVEVTRVGQQCGEADGFWTRNSEIQINVITADCVPILLYRQDSQAVAALHAGWRGTFARIAERFFESLPPELSRPQEWKAIVGPSIRASCYEVTPELVTQFKEGFQGLAPDRIEPSYRKLDLIAVNRFQLETLGVEVEVHPDCTFCTLGEDGKHRYASYRRGDRHARQFSWISI